ncbi:MAG: metal-dependent transcriptional regulator [Planctomycetes bacterium]|nr:metal-dependent transcriptional regulator [Planctomycetota bacterium]
MVSRPARRLTSSQEDYLEAILALVRQENVARVRDIANRLGVGKSAVTGALKVLAKRKLVNYDPYEFITLTERGQAAAERVIDRHTALRHFCRHVLALDDAAAEANACRLEHCADDQVLLRLEQLVTFMETDLPDGRSVREGFHRFLADEERSEEPCR